VSNFIQTQLSPRTSLVSVARFYECFCGCRNLHSTLTGEKPCQTSTTVGMTTIGLGSHLTLSHFALSRGRALNLSRSSASRRHTRRHDDRKKHPTELPDFPKLICHSIHPCLFVSSAPFPQTRVKVKWWLNRAIFNGSKITKFWGAITLHADSTIAVSSGWDTRGRKHNHCVERFGPTFR
jgi:hypothetical protein